MQYDSNELIENLLKVAQEAGRIIREIYLSPDADWNVSYKNDDSPLTQADRAAHNFIINRLQALTPDIPCLSEESEAIPFNTRKNWECYWLIDPLDGTKEFISRSGEFTVNIALMESDRPILSAVEVPMTLETYVAERGKGAFKHDKKGRTSIYTFPFSLHSKGIRITCSRSHLREEEKQFMSRFDQPTIIPQGSALKILRIAEGKADLYPRFGPTMEWDTASAELILEEAGGHIFQASGAIPMEYNKQDLYNPHFICCGQLDAVEIQDLFR